MRRTGRRGYPRDRFYELQARLNQSVRLADSLISNGSFRILWQFFKYHYRHGLLRKPVPYYFSMAVTNRCQGHCIHCYSHPQRKDNRSELTTPEFLSVIDQAAGLGAFLIIFTGGEPLLRDDVTELVRRAHDKGFLTRLNTNGWLLDRKTIAALKKEGLNQCAVSLDDADPETHDRLRGMPGHHRKTLESVRVLREFNVYTLVNIYVSKRHLASGLEKTVACAKASGADGIIFLPAVASGRWDQAFDCVPDQNDMAEIRRFQDFFSVHMEQCSSRSKCDALNKFVIYLTAQGDLTPCPFVPYVIGNIKDHPIEEMWRRYCEGLILMKRGECTMNDPAYRSELERHVKSVAKSLEERECKNPFH